jgi:hypothetical protein
MSDKMPAQKKKRTLRRRYGHAPARAAVVAEAMHLAPWVNNIENLCLYEVVLEALTARVSAVRHDGDPKMIAAGDATLEAISSGRVAGDLACRKAAVALRKYTRSYGQA